MSSVGHEDNGERPHTGGRETLTVDSPPESRKSEGFLAYLSHYRQGSASWSALWDTIADLRKRGLMPPGIRFDAEKWIEALIEQGPDGTGYLSEPHLTDCIATLLQVESEWRLDLRIRHPKSKGKDVVTARDWMLATPEDSILNRCRYVLPGSARECGRGTVPGTSRCRDHGGALVDEKTRRAVLMGAYLGLVDATDVAVSTLTDVAVNGRNELARVQAARELLDRAGLTADLNVTVRIEGDERTARITALQDRLDTMGQSLRHRVAGAIETSASPTPVDDVTVAPEEDVTVAHQDDVTVEDVTVANPQVSDLPVDD